jgi:putative transposase
MILPSHKLSVSRQAKILGIARSTVYYQPLGPSEADLLIMSKLDRLHLEYPFAGARMLRDLLRQEDFLGIGRRRIRRLMRHMGIEPIYRRENTSRPHPAHAVYPYLLRHLKIDRPNQVWSMDITYLPMRKGFLYLVAVMDWYSRKILAWKLSNTMHAEFCVTALREAIAKHGIPEIMNTDQGSQFTSLEFIQVLKDHDIKISMDGKGCWRDNVFIERFWRTVKYEEVYLRAYECTSDARDHLTRYLKFYNQIRPHSALDGHTPDQVYFANINPAAIAA